MFLIRLRDLGPIRRASVPLVASVLFAACRRDAPVVRVDSTAPTVATTSDTSTPAPRTNGWNLTAGPVLLVAGPSPDEAIVFLGVRGEGTTPALDTGAVDQGAVTLFGRDGSRSTATLELPAGNDTAECRIWPLRNLRTSGKAGTWSVGFVSDNVGPVPLDSVDALSARDSMALVAEASRLASGVTANTAPTFQGLRFTAHDIRRFEAAPGVQALAAQLSRRVNQEADPQEEQTLLIAERDSGVTSGPYQLAYAERAFGKEDEVSTSEVVAAVRIGQSGQPSLVVAREGNDGLAYALLERSGGRRWKVRWTSALAKCTD
ncbi:MAG: hypothetical protein ABI601_00275 [bacterium]